MVKRVHEVWAGKGGAAMFTRGAKNARETLPASYQLVRTFEAESRFEAFRTHYRLMGFGSGGSRRELRTCPTLETMSTISAENLSCFGGALAALTTVLD